MEIIFVLLFAMLSIAIYVAADGLISVAFDDDDEEKENMARSYFIWKVTLDDDTELKFVANSISQILYNGINIDWDEIIKIEQVELYYSNAENDYPDIIDLRN